MDLTGWTAAQRAARRKMYLDREIDHARELARVRERTVKCAAFTGRHAGDEGGCKSDGSNCLCECHDPKENAPDAVQDHVA